MHTSYFKLSTFNQQSTACVWLVSIPKQAPVLFNLLPSQKSHLLFSPPRCWFQKKKEISFFQGRSEVTFFKVIYCMDHLQLQQKSSFLEQIKKISKIHFTSCEISYRSLTVSNLSTIFQCMWILTIANLIKDNISVNNQ